jgi:hypothetical protein
MKGKRRKTVKQILIEEGVLDELKKEFWGQQAFTTTRGNQAYKKSCEILCEIMRRKGVEEAKRAICILVDWVYSKAGQSWWSSHFHKMTTRSIESDYV